MLYIKVYIYSPVLDLGLPTMLQVQYAVVREIFVVKKLSWLSGKKENLTHEINSTTNNNINE